MEEHETRIGPRRGPQQSAAWHQRVPLPEEGGGRNLLRSRPVAVHLPDGGLYNCDRGDILEHLPNTRRTPFGRDLRPHLARENENLHSLQALHVIFRGLEAFRATGAPLYLFERAREVLYRDDRAVYGRVVQFFVGACLALDAEYGLGCSEELLQQMDEFVLDLVEAHPEGFFDQGRITALFRAYSKVFRPTTPRHLDTLRKLCNLVPALPRALLMADLARSVERSSQRSNVASMFRAMRDLGLA
ncbi:hypothetical protein F4780DRAFT_777538 [Xylariomycetidae sp. FL0641]|nr:hypothetical protein F4780DRAFT_777538 [Xylariomycetidae sp. FL0641]